MKTKKLKKKPLLKRFKKKVASPNFIGQNEKKTPYYRLFTII